MKVVVEQRIRNKVGSPNPIGSQYLNGLKYFPDSGIVSRNVAEPRMNRKSGPIGSPDKKGYLNFHHMSNQFKVHRAAFTFMGEPLGKDEMADHINGDPSDNRWCNLRRVDRRGNQINQKIHRAGRLPGYHKCKRTGKYVALIKIDKIPYRLGSFDTDEEAHAAYMAAVADNSIAFKLKEKIKDKKVGYYRPERDCWTVKVRVGGKRIYLGSFKTQDECHEAYLKFKELN